MFHFQLSKRSVAALSFRELMICPMDWIEN